MRRREAGRSALYRVITRAWYRNIADRVHRARAVSIPLTGLLDRTVFL